MTPARTPCLTSIDDQCDWPSLLDENQNYSDFYTVQLDASALIATSALNRPLQTLAHMSYAWMPRILGHVTVPASMTEASLVRDVRNWNDIRECIQWLTELDVSTDPPINSSWVGTSKTFHFLAPHAMPIWDSRVARHFGRTSHQQVNHKPSFLRYLLWCQEERDRNRAVIARFCHTHEAICGYRVTPVRALEFMLFLSAPVIFRQTAKN